MGHGGPLDHPELREIERLLGLRDLAGAQRQLARLNDSAALADGAAFLTTCLLRARGKLDRGAVVDRLRDLLARTPSFPEAQEFLKHVESGSTPTEPPPEPVGAAAQTTSAPAPPPAVAPRTEPAGQPREERRAASRWPLPEVDTTAARGASWPPLPSGQGDAAQLLRGPNPATVPASPRAPGGRSDQSSPQPSLSRGRYSSAPPPSGRGPESRPRVYAPLPGVDSFVTRPRKSSLPAEPQLPSIPKAPAIPQFRDNRAAPSYLPVSHEPAGGPAKGKSLLPQSAGRYSQMPSTTDVVDSRHTRRSQPPTRGSSDPAKETIPHTPERIRPGSSLGRGPSLLELATWIDEGRFTDAIAAINRAGGAARGPELSVLHTRALAGAGYVDQAFDALEKLEREPLLEPELRAACARLFVELGSPERGLQLARRALEADPEQPSTRLTFALAAVRVARRSPSETLLHKADAALGPLPLGKEGQHTALHLALKACILSASGDPERAIAVAQRALGLDSRSPDALAAVAQASARLGHAHDAQKAWARLRDLSPDEAEVVARHLVQHGIPTGASRPPSGRPSGAPAEGNPLWSAAELDLALGQRGEAMRIVETGAQETVRRVTRSGSQSGLTALATVAAAFFTTSPILSCFAPYDLSLWSLRRLEAALSVLYGPDRRPRLSTDDAALVLLAGSYLGEALRLAHGGRWEGGLSNVDTACVSASGKRWHPFRIVTGRLQQGKTLSISDAVRSGMQTGGGPPWQSRIGNPVAPPTPWAPSHWPRPSQIGLIGRTLPGSPIGRFCQDLAEGSLDRSTGSIVSLDTYLALVAPVAAPHEPDAAWARRVAVLVGGYVGETLRDQLGGEWKYGIDKADDPSAFRLVLSTGVEATPVVHVLERVGGKRSSTLVDYARTLMARVSAT